MPKRQVGDVVYLESADSSGVETEYENLIYESDGMTMFKRRKLYKIRYTRTLPNWMKEKEEEEEKLKKIEALKKVPKDNKI